MAKKFTLIVAHEGVLRHQIEELKKYGDAVSVEPDQLTRFWKGYPMLEVSVEPNGKPRSHNGNGAYPGLPLI